MITCLDLYTTRAWPSYGKAARSGCSVPLGKYFFGEYLWWCTDEAWRDYLRGHRARMTREEWLRIYSEPKLATSGQAVWKGTARRLVEQQSRQRALCLSQQESTRQPEQQHRLSGCGAVCPRSSAPSSGPTAGRDGAPGHRPRSGNAGRSAQAGLPAEAKEEEQRQTRLVRAHAARQGDTGGIAGAGRIHKPGHGLVKTHRAHPLLLTLP